MKRTKQNKLLATFLAIAMMMTMFPTVVFAENEGAHTTTINENEKIQTESDLLLAIQDATGTKDDPVVITISQDIMLTSPISFSNKFILIQGENPDITISTGDSFATTSNLFNIGASSDMGTLENPTSSLSLKNITIDLEKRGRAILATKAEINLLDGCTIQNGYFYKDGGGAIYLSNQAMVNMHSGAVVKNNEATGNGGAFCIWPDGTLNIYGGMIDGNSANYGSAAWNSGGTIYIEGGTFLNNSGSDYGVVGSQGGSICIIDSKNSNDPVRIIGNRNVNYRTGIYGNNGSTLFIKGALFQDNQVEQNTQAGAVTWGGSSNGKGTCEIENCTFIGNQQPAFRLHDTAIFGANKTDKTQTVALGRTLLTFSKAIPEGSILDIFYINNGLLNENVLVVQGTEDYQLTAEDLKKINFSSDSSGTYALVLDEKNNQLKTAKGVTITFNANNGDDSETYIQKVPLNQEATLDNNTFTCEGYVFDGWNTQADGKGTTYKNCAEVTFSQDTELYAMWHALDAVPKELSIEYSSENSIPVSDDEIVLKDLISSDTSVVSVKDDKLKAEHVGEAVITATATTQNGGEAELKVTVKVTPMLITYGSTGDDVIGWDETYNRPAVVYSQPVGEEEQLSNHIWFYPARESVDAGSGEQIYIPNTEAAPIKLEQGEDLTFSYTQNGNHVENIGVLPFLETLDSEGNSEAIDVIVDLQNENYKFVTIGTLWNPWNQILLRVTVMAEGMERISMMNGNQLLQNTLEKRILEYTGEGVAPAYDLTNISAEEIEVFTVHFHSVIEGISHDTHLYNKQPAELSEDTVQAIAPKELGVYSMVVNGQNDEAKKYAYVSRRFEIIKGNPTGTPDFEAVESGVELSAIELSGSMMNAAGKPVEGVFEWVDASQIAEQGAAYAWRFTPNDSEHYNVAEGESVVWPEAGPANDKEDLAALIKYAQDAQKDENYKYLVPKVKDLFEKALADAIAVNEKEDATQKEVEEAYDALLAKVHLLDFTGNTENLTVLVATAEGKNEELYTKESWEPFAKALQAAKELLKDPNALQAKLDAAHGALQAAMDALIENPIDTSKLEKLVKEASVYEAKIENYIPSTAESFMAALEGAREVLANIEISGSEITQDAVDSAYTTLLNAIFGLREVPNKDKLEELLGKVEAMDLSAYSEETANAVKAAVAMAEAVMEDENANQKQVDAAVAALEEAVAALESKDEADDITDASDSDKVDNDASISDETEEDSKKDGSSATDNKVASNDEGSKDTAKKTIVEKTDGKAAVQTGDAAKAAIPAVAATATLLAVWFVWKKK